MDRKRRCALAASILMETCRFCLEESVSTTLLEPCQCRGSVRYVHRECLEQEFAARTQAGLSARNCRICGTPYSLTPPLSLLVMVNILLPATMVGVSVYAPTPITLTILSMATMMNWTLCFFWTLTPVVFVLQSKVIRGLLAAGLLLPVSEWSPTLSILLAFIIPYAAFVNGICEDTPPRRILFGCFGLAEFSLLMGSLLAQPVHYSACLLLSVLSVLPISVSMVMG
jgi:hypothetical protein